MTTPKDGSWMAKKSKKPKPETVVPKAQISVTFLIDSDVVLLLEKRSRGLAAIGVFVLLVLLARRENNGGKFTSPLRIVAKQINCNQEEIKKAIKLIGDACKENGTEPWLSHDGSVLEIRSYSKWHTYWGGPRENAGRKPKKRSDESSENQVVSRNQSSYPLPSPIPSSPNGEDPPKPPDAKPTRNRSVCTESQARSIYDLYPRHVKPNMAVKAIQRAAQRLSSAGSSDPVAHLQERTVRYAGSRYVSTAPVQVIPHPATWFNGGGFDEDESEWDREYVDFNARKPIGAVDHDARREATQRVLAEAERLEESRR